MNIPKPMVNLVSCAILSKEGRKAFRAKHAPPGIDRTTRLLKELKDGQQSLRKALKSLKESSLRQEAALAGLGAPGHGLDGHPGIDQPEASIAGLGAPPPFMELEMTADPATNLRLILAEACRLTDYQAKIPSMLIGEEKRLLHLLLSHYYSGVGEIFSGGCCLAGDVEAMVNGLRQNPRFPGIAGRIHAYEWGQVDGCQYLVDFIKQNYGITLSLSGSFLDITKSNLESLDPQDRVAFYPGDILTKSYPENIEIMFIDVAKSSQLNHAMQRLFARLIPGKSVVIQQDYIHDCLPFLRVTMGYLREYFEFIGTTRINSALFLLQRPIPMEVLEVNPYENFGTEELLEMHDHYNQYLNPRQIELIRHNHAEILARG